MSEIKPGRIAVSVFCLFLVMLGASFADLPSAIGSLELRQVNIFSDLYPPTEELPDPDSILPVVKPIETAIFPVDTFSHPIVFFSEHEAGCWDTLFRKCAHALGKNARKPVRIGYYGDSMIEGDLLTQDLRSLLQQKFGGRGLGWLPVTSVVSSFRKTINHTFDTERWTTYSALNNAELKKIGIQGYGFQPATTERADSANAPWVRYAIPGGPVADSLSVYVLYKGNDDTATLYTCINDTIFRHQTLVPDRAVHKITLFNDKKLSSIRISVASPDTMVLLGVYIESRRGVILENFSLRGNSGLTFSGMPYTIFKETNKQAPLDLIVYHYGLNVMGEGDFSKSMNWYKSGLVSNLSYLRNMYPNVPILVASVTDKGKKDDAGEVSTDPNVPMVVACQQYAADSVGLAFWNLYDAMGGSGSMVKWVRQSPPLAGTDYTHINGRGGKKVAEMLFNAILHRYEQYLAKTSKQPS